MAKESEKKKIEKKQPSYIPLDSGTVDLLLDTIFKKRAELFIRLA